MKLLLKLVCRFLGHSERTRTRILNCGWTETITYCPRCGKERYWDFYNQKGELEL